MKKFLFILLVVVFNNETFAEDKMTLGLDVYKNKAQCGTCHVLQAAGSEGQIGPNLDLLKPPISRIIYAVKNGIGVMPAWEGVLTEEEIEAVAHYIFNNTNN